MNDYVKCDHIATDRLITELEQRAHDTPGDWREEQVERIAKLAAKLLPKPEHSR